jgi:hypothetical protein
MLASLPVRGIVRLSPSEECMPETSEDQALPALASELKDLVLRYLRQETLEPIKDLGRFVIFGVVGSMVLVTGLTLLLVGLLRGLQEETGTTFTGNLTWVPYGICALTGLAVALVAAAAITRGRGKSRAKRGAGA